MSWFPVDLSISVNADADVGASTVVTVTTVPSAASASVGLAAIGYPFLAVVWTLAAVGVVGVEVGRIR